MRYQVVIARSAQAQFEKLDARWRSRLKREMLKHLVNAPRQQSKSRIKRLEGLRQPQYRMRVDQMRIFYDVNDTLKRVEVLAFVRKPDTRSWLEEQGIPE